jgi:hypothetical protein
MSKITIEDLKGTTAPQSPKKYSKKLTCAILTKSPIRPTRNGSMFSINLCDQDLSSTVRAVCFDKNMFDKFEANGTYDFEQFKVKKGYGSTNTVEILIDQSTLVKKAASQMKLKECCFTISQILRGDTCHIRFINLQS